MMLNSVNNNQPAFGMALKKPNASDMKKFAKAVGTASDSFITKTTARREKITAITLFIVCTSAEPPFRRLL